MSVLIRGMEMPENCRDCPCFCEEYFYCRAKEGDDIGLENRPKDCPLIPVPDHGRLIDADALMAKDDKDFSTIMEMTDPGTVFGTALADAHTAIQEMLKTAPTIIPAEEGET